METEEYQLSGAQAFFKKSLEGPMPQSYCPKDVESDWDNLWCSCGFFSPNFERAKTLSQEEKFVMALPPPNVTGCLHIGHTLTSAIQDSLCRYHRMCGKEVLWIPGTDHAGIATQTVVERILLKNENKSRHDYGRDEFLTRVWDWKEKYGTDICTQLRRLGCSFDWTRKMFTMDEYMSKAVSQAFINLFNQGYIYRGTRLVSWCSYLCTALSDIEVEVMEIQKPTRLRIPGYDKTVEVGILWYFSYPFQQEGQQYSWHFEPENLSKIPKITVATTRLETMLGDVAVAVHPNDERYKDLVGNICLHPFLPERKIRVITDEYVDPEFGTGCVKITPAHDKNDFDVAIRYNSKYKNDLSMEQLEFISIFTLDGKMSNKCASFSGMHRFACRELCEKELSRLNLLVDKTPNTKSMQLPICSRSDDIVELIMIPQWWMNCKPFAEMSCKAVRNKELVIEPKFHEQTWFHWLENIQDWCISRQLWWGHRIPAYRVCIGNINAEEKPQDIWVAADSEEEAIKEVINKFQLKLGEFTIERDTDVLDTWFSSGLIPFSPLGWPYQLNPRTGKDDLSTFFPTTLLETGSDILFFWVARMVMLSYACTGKLPFKTVYLHAMVRDAQGRKMSKSLGNVIDPLEVIEGISLEDLNDKVKKGNLPALEIKRSMESNSKDFPTGIPECGADALRYGLLAYTKQGRNINLDIKRVVAYRHFCNKLWNACKFAFGNIEKLKEIYSESTKFQALSLNNILENYHSYLMWEDFFIIHRLNECITKVSASFKEYLFAEAVAATYNFWLYELCDIYLELTKLRFKELNNSKSVFVAAQILCTCIDLGLRLLHPMIPFVTEELYQRLYQLVSSPNRFLSISIAKFPTVLKHSQLNYKKDLEYKMMMRIVSQIRSLTSIMEIPNKEKLSITVYIIYKGQDSDTIQLLETVAESFITKLANIGSTVTVINPDIKKVNELKSRYLLDIVDDKIDIYLTVPQKVDLSQALQKIDKKLAVNQKSLESYEIKKKSPAYDKVPKSVKLLNEEKIDQLSATIASLEIAKKNVESLLK
ncbi:putative valyl-tRNA synthetase [Cryptosporidium serpentis]